MRNLPAGLDHSLNNITIARAISLLKNSGWNIEIEKRYIEAVNPSGHSLYLPSDLAAILSRQQAVDILHYIASDAISLSDVITMASTGTSHLVATRSEDETIVAGTIPATRAKDLFSALVDSVRYTAAGILTARTSYRQMPRDAKRFMRTCRVGQTEIGSYRIKVYFPSNISGAPKTRLPDVSFGDAVQSSLEQSLAYLELEPEETITDNIPRTLNQNVASAISRLLPDRGFATATISMCSISQANSNRMIKSRRIDRDIAYKARRIADYFKQREIYEVGEFTGYITDLHKDRPSDGGVETGIVLEVRDGGRWKQLSMSLLPSEYAKSLQWHNEHREVFLKATVDRNRSPWRVVDLLELHPLGDERYPLFTRS